MNFCPWVPENVMPEHYFSFSFFVHIPVRYYPTETRAVFYFPRKRGEACAGRREQPHQNVLPAAADQERGGGVGGRHSRDALRQRARGEGCPPQREDRLDGAGAPVFRWTA